jgi:hypothetical protein
MAAFLGARAEMYWMAYVTYAALIWMSTGSSPGILSYTESLIVSIENSSLFLDSKLMLPVALVPGAMITGCGFHE